MVIIQSVLINKSNCWHLKYILDHILEELSFFDTFSISRCYRELNKLVDFLVNVAIDSSAQFKNVEVSDIPQDILQGYLIQSKGIKVFDFVFVVRFHYLLRYSCYPLL